MSWTKTARVQNPEYREEWVRKALKALVSDRKQNLLDVGAGSSPYRKVAESLGYNYASHDFNGYTPRNSEVKLSGLHNFDWEYAEHDFICEILEIPETQKYDLILCTEVLEHIPDPVRVFEKLNRMLNNDGFLVISVPLMSLMHQAPYWFQAGLSPYWFEYWSEKNNLKIISLEVFGDYLDLVKQESIRSIFTILKFKGSGQLARAAMKILEIFRRRFPAPLLESGGFGTLYIGQK